MFLVNFSKSYPTLLNNIPVIERVPLSHKDVFTIIDRSFRLELPQELPYDTQESVIEKNNSSSLFKTVTDAATTYNLIDGTPKEIPKTLARTPKVTSKSKSADRTEKGTQKLLTKSLKETPKSKFANGTPKTHPKSAKGTPNMAPVIDSLNSPNKGT